MDGLTYKGTTFPARNAAEVRDLFQLFLDDLSQLSEKIPSIEQRLSNKDYWDKNRDMWLQQFAAHAGQQYLRIGTGQNQNQNPGISPIGLLSLFNRKTPVLVPSASQTTTPTAAPTSPHRVPSPRAESLDTSVPTIEVSPESTDRAHILTLDFTAAFTATNPVGNVTFNAPYSTAPVVILAQLDATFPRNFRVVTVTPTGYVFTCDDFPSAELHRVQACVIHPSED